MTTTTSKFAALSVIAVAQALASAPAAARDTVKIAFIGPLSGGVSANE